MNSLKSIAKQGENISFKQLSNIYNNFKIVDPQDVAKLSKIKITNNQILIMATKRPENPTKPPAGFTSYMSRFEKRIDQRIDKLDNRLTQIVKANNLIDPTTQK